MRGCTIRNLAAAPYLLGVKAAFFRRKRRGTLRDFKRKPMGGVAKSAWQLLYLGKF